MKKTLYLWVSFRSRLLRIDVLVVVELSVPWVNKDTYITLHHTVNAEI